MSYLNIEFSKKNKIKSIDKYKEIFDIKKLNAEFSKQTFKEIMIATQDNNNRIKNIDKEKLFNFVNGFKENISKKR